jgi:hypothetical protein
MRTFYSALAAVALLCAASVAWADSPEDAYIAARDDAIKALKEKSAANPDDKDLTAQEQKLRGDLQAQLQSLINPAIPTGFSGPPTMSPDTLFADDEGAGALDGLNFAGKGSSGQLLVTTEGLLIRWLQAHKDVWKDQPNPPADAASAFASPDFYTQAVSADAAVSIFATVPIHQPAGASTAVALLVEESQDLATYPPDRLAVSVVKGGKVYIAIVNTKKFPPIAACTAVWNGFKAKADAAFAKYRASGLKDEKSFDAKTGFEKDGETAFHKCWGEHASAAPAFAALTKQAQTLADTLAAQ